MTSGHGLDERLSEAMRADAEAAALAADTERELARLRARWRRDASRRRTLALTVAACVAVALLAAGLAGRPSGAPPPDGDHHERHVRALRLDTVPAPEAEVRLVPLSRRDAPVVLRGHVDALWPETGGRLWVLAADPSTLEWTLTRLGPDRRTVQAQVRFASGTSLWGAPWVTATDDVLVLALPEGGPLPAAERFSDRHDGLLRIDRRTGRILGYTRVETATVVDAADDGTVWAVASPDRVANLDPVTGRILRTLRTPGLVDRVLVQGDRLWLAYQQADPSRGWLVDARTGQVLRAAVLAGQTIHLPVDGGVVLVRSDGRVTRLGRDGSVTAVQLRLPSGAVVSDATVSDGDVWLWVGDRGLVRLSGTTLGVDGAVALPWPGPAPLARQGDHVLLAEAATATVRRFPLSALIGL